MDTPRSIHTETTSNHGEPLLQLVPPMKWAFGNACIRDDELDRSALSVITVRNDKTNSILDPPSAYLSRVYSVVCTQSNRISRGSVNVLQVLSTPKLSRAETIWIAEFSPAVSHTRLPGGRPGQEPYYPYDYRVQPRTRPRRARMMRKFFERTSRP
ncbi:uncharacterized protein P174DRAFT_25862 [Aspergillus novofumigatus IBT 16806]|uniref:Uncharacterized protein n=1 Tax=Aspergillus novofumigatus (strain IBT 16806) TaxID=1392255 RepID=A0A2I1CM77_ASPN1|nr:uncharacterized protein P174DRAFT_25862 [Aspergillus novofumigatus IBT 16806]PKX98705.1 hypothetical protein P174DRAFT_25862 [Aspergillus novofumigatus IBT 16806]